MPPLAEVLLQPARDHQLAQLADEALVRGEEQVLGELLGDRAAPAREAPALAVLLHRLLDGVPVHALVAEELLVLGGQHGVDEVARDAAEGHPRPGARRGVRPARRASSSRWRMSAVGAGFSGPAPAPRRGRAGRGHETPRPRPGPGGRRSAARLHIGPLSRVPCSVRRSSRRGAALDFSLSEEQQLLKKTVREFAESGAGAALARMGREAGVPARGLHEARPDGPDGRRLARRSTAAPA